MKRLAVILLLATDAFAAPPRSATVPRGCRDRSCVRERSGQSGNSGPTAPTDFEFAQIGGAGMGSACACLNPTGTLGEALTFERNSSAWCSKSGDAAGIRAGDIVACDRHQARVMPGGSGAGVLGVLIEPQRWNFLDVNNSFSNSAIWHPLNLLSSDPVVKIGAGVGPLGTTVDLVQFAAATGTGESIIYATGTDGCSIDGGIISASVYLAGAADGGASASGTLDMCTISGATWTCAACAFVPYVALVDGGSSGWTRCKSENVNGDTGANGYFVLGNSPFVNGGVSRPLQGVYLSLAQCENGPNVTSPMLTGSGRVFRYPDVLTAQVTLSGSSRSTTATLETPGVIVSGETVTQIWIDGGNADIGNWNGSAKLACTNEIAGSANITATSGAATASAANVTSCGYAASIQTASLAGVAATTSGALSLPVGPATLYLGTRAITGNEATGVVKQVTLSGGVGCSDCSHVAWLGDSLSGARVPILATEQTLATVAPEQYSLVSGRSVDNWAHAGDELTDAEAQWATWGQPSGADRIVVWIGINDIAAGADGATLATAYQAWLGTILAGSQVKFITVVGLAAWGNYSQWTSSKQIQANVFNAAMATYCSSHVATTKFVDMQDVTDAGSSVALSASLDIGDGLHFKQTGATYCGNIIAAASP